MNNIKIFVPGRVGIIGEISDLVTPYLKENKKLIPGSAIAIRIDKGIYATITKSDNFSIYLKEKKFEVKFESEELEKIAKDKKNFYSYICGTALYMKKKYKVKGIKVIIDKNDLPIKKGLSSSAAICILIAKAFDKIYNLHMKKDEQIEAAYQGEHLALSKCGKLDQVTILENNLVKIVFEEKKPKVESIKVAKNMYFVIADLNSKKNTVKIMNDISDCFPYPKNKNDKKVQDFMSKKNKKIVDSTAKYIAQGNLKKVGKNLIKYQKMKDNCRCVCSEFVAPKLHLILKDKKIKKMSYGAKDVGSGGDGSVQIMAKTEQSMLDIEKYLLEKYQLSSTCITIKKN